MPMSVLFLTEFDDEMTKTRKTLERVPAAKAEWTPHAKSTPFGKLAAHIAQLGGFATAILTMPALDFGQGNFTPLKFESAEQLVNVFDDGVAQSRRALAGTSDSAWTEPWKLSFNGTTLFEGTRYLAYRQMYVDHLVHHRAQLGVYLRLNGQPVPSIYGPSADESFG